MTRQKLQVNNSCIGDVTMNDGSATANNIWVLARVQKNIRPVTIMVMSQNMNMLDIQ